jgi:hypothetical protein
VNAAWATDTAPEDCVTATLMVCGPSGSVRVSNGRAVPLLLPPAKSHGALFSVVRGVPVIVVSSSQKRADTPLSGVAKTYMVPATVRPCRAAGDERSAAVLTWSA